MISTGVRQEFCQCTTLVTICKKNNSLTIFCGVHNCQKSDQSLNTREKVRKRKKTLTFERFTLFLVLLFCLLELWPSLEFVVLLLFIIQQAHVVTPTRSIVPRQAPIIYSTGRHSNRPPYLNVYGIKTRHPEPISTCKVQQAIFFLWQHQSKLKRKKEWLCKILLTLTVVCFGALGGGLHVMELSVTLASVQDSSPTNMLKSEDEKPLLRFTP